MQKYFDNKVAAALFIICAFGLLVGIMLWISLSRNPTSTCSPLTNLTDPAKYCIMEMFGQ